MSYLQYKYVSTQSWTTYKRCNPLVSEVLLKPRTERFHHRRLVVLKLDVTRKGRPDWENQWHSSSYCMLLSCQRKYINGSFWLNHETRLTRITIILYSVRLKLLTKTMNGLLRSQPSRAEGHFLTGIYKEYCAEVLSHHVLLDILLPRSQKCLQF